MKKIIVVALALLSLPIFGMEIQKVDKNKNARLTSLAMAKLVFCFDSCTLGNEENCFNHCVMQKPIPEETLVKHFILRYPDIQRGLERARQKSKFYR